MESAEGAPNPTDEAVSVPWWGSAPTVVAAAAAIVMVLVVAVAIRAARAVVSSRRDRIELGVVPTCSFDPQPEEIMRYAAQLLRTHRVTDRVLVPAGAHMVRVALRSTGDGRMVQTVSGPARAGSILRQRGFDQVELVASEVLAERLAGIDPSDPTRRAPQPGPDPNDPPGRSTPPAGQDGGGQATPGRQAPGPGRSAPRWSCLHESGDDGVS